MLDEPSSAELPASRPALPVAPNATTVLVVDDERSNVASLEKIFLREGMRVLTADDAKAALEIARTHRVHVVLTDLMMPGTSGVELLRALKQVSPDTEVVLMTAYGTVETAVQAMREGAYDFVEKPLKRMTIVKSVRKAAERQSLVEENRSLQQRDQAAHAARDRGHEPRRCGACSTSRRRPRRRRPRCSCSARAAPARSCSRATSTSRARAREAPFVAVNCAAIPETILEASSSATSAARSPARSPTRGALRQGRGRHALPRRDRRALAVGAGEAPARACRKASTSRSAATR